MEVQLDLSVLTQPYLFNGSPDYFTRLEKRSMFHCLMKDIVIDKIQIDAAEKLGADVVLLIQSIFDKKFAKILMNLFHMHIKKIF